MSVLVADPGTNIASCSLIDGFPLNLSKCILVPFGELVIMRCSQRSSTHDRRGSSFGQVSHFDEVKLESIYLRPRVMSIRPCLVSVLRI